MFGSLSLNITCQRVLHRKYHCLMVQIIVCAIVCVKCCFVLFIEEICSSSRSVLAVQKNWFVTKTPEKQNKLLDCLSAAKKKQTAEFAN